MHKLKDADSPASLWEPQIDLLFIKRRTEIIKTTPSNTFLQLYYEHMFVFPVYNKAWVFQTIWTLE